MKDDPYRKTKRTSQRSALTLKEVPSLPTHGPGSDRGRGSRPGPCAGRERLLYEQLFLPYLLTLVNNGLPRRGRKGRRLVCEEGVGLCVFVCTCVSGGALCVRPSVGLSRAPAVGGTLGG